MKTPFKALLAIFLMCLPFLSDATETDGRYVTRQCGIPPQQPTILPVTGEAMNLISAHRAKTTAWLECANQKAVYGGDWALIRLVDHSTGLWVLDGLQRVRDAGYPTSEYVESVTK